MNKNSLVFLLFLVCFVFSINAQNSSNKWAFGFNTSVVVFAEDASVGDRINSQYTNLLLTRKLENNLSVDLMYTFDAAGPITGLGANSFEYSSIDAYLRYDLPELFLNIVPFVGVGFGYISSAEPTLLPERVFSLNLKAGGTLWLTSRLGLSGRLIYKNVFENSESLMDSHFQILAGIVYEFDFGKNKGEQRKRIWERKN